jgi:hypothetical protein
MMNEIYFFFLMSCKKHTHNNNTSYCDGSATLSVTKKYLIFIGLRLSDVHISFPPPLPPLPLLPCYYYYCSSRRNEEREREREFLEFRKNRTRAATALHSHHSQRTNNKTTTTQLGSF